MSNVSEPASAGQVTDPADDLSPFVDVLEKHTKAVLRMSAAMVRISDRIDALEDLLEELEEMVSSEATRRADAAEVAGEPVTDREPKSGDVVPPLALRSDGAILVHVSEIIGTDLPDRETWTGVLLSQAESSDVLAYISHGFSEAAGRVGAWIAKTSKKADEEGGES